MDNFIVIKFEKKHKLKEIKCKQRIQTDKNKTNKALKLRTETQTQCYCQEKYKRNIENTKLY